MKVRMSTYFNFLKHKFLRITNTPEKKKIRDFYFRDKVTMSDRTPYNFPQGNDDSHSVHFQRQNDSKISTLIKACWSLSVKNCHAKGKELTLRMYSCSEWIVGYEKFPQFAR